MMTTTLRKLLVSCAVALVAACGSGTGDEIVIKDEPPPQTKAAR